MKVANLIMAYKNPRQIERMLKTMSHPDFYFFIHLDKKIDMSEFQYLAKLERVFFLKNRVLCNWGGFSFVDAIFTSLEEILGLEVKYDVYNLLSAQDYPIKPINEIYRFYEQNIGKCFVSYDEDSNSEWWGHAVTRFEFYHLTDLRFRGKYFVQSLMHRFLPKRKFPLPMKLYGSSISSWWSISAECAAYIVAFIKENQQLKNFMKYTWGADEFLITTIIMNSSFRQSVVNNNLRYIKWMDGSANPRILSVADFESIKASDKLFARKFDTTVDELILDRLDLFVKG